MTPRAAPQWIPVLPPAVRYPVFARLWSLMSSHEAAEIRRHRDELLAGLSGRVIEVGAGVGTNFAHYPPTVEQVMAVEPEPYLVCRACSKISQHVGVSRGVESWNGTRASNHEVIYEHALTGTGSRRGSERKHSSRGP